MDDEHRKDEMRRVKRGWILVAALVLGLFAVHFATDA
jgi:hypothetical protein